MSPWVQISKGWHQPSDRIWWCEEKHGAYGASYSQMIEKLTWNGCLIKPSRASPGILTCARRVIFLALTSDIRSIMWPLASIPSIREGMSRTISLRAACLPAGTCTERRNWGDVGQESRLSASILAWWDQNVGVAGVAGVDGTTGVKQSWIVLLQPWKEHMRERRQKPYRHPGV